jgi:hypothetical protein
MSECMVQRVCLDPGLTFDQVDCVNRYSCDEPIAPPINNIKYRVDVSSKSTCDDTTKNNKEKGYIHALPKKTSDDGPMMMPVDVFSMIMLIIMIILVVWVVFGLVTGKL